MASALLTSSAAGAARAKPAATTSAWRRPRLTSSAAGAARARPAAQHLLGVGPGSRQAAPASLARAGAFLDGGYLQQLRRSEFRGATADLALLAERIRDRIAGDTAEPLDILRTYYYDCPPYRSEPPAPEEARRFADYRRFADALRDLPRFEVREGRLQISGRRPDGSPIFQQKQVDLLLGLDLALLSVRGRITHAALVAGDGDFVPAVRAAKREGVAVWLFHGPSAGSGGRPIYSSALHREADGRAEMDAAFMASVARASG